MCLAFFLLLRMQKFNLKTKYYGKTASKTGKYRGYE